MATWKQENIMLTKVGEQALANAEAGEGKITITKVIGSSFSSEDIYNVNSQTQISENITFSVVEKESLEDSVGTSIHIQAVNKNLTAKFRLNTIVVYATHNSIGSGAFPYMIAKAENADEINTPDTTPTTLNYSLTIINTRGGLLNITLNPAGLVPMSTFVNAKKALEEKIGNDIEAHNTSENAHQKIIDKINSHKNMAEIDHPDSSVTTRKLRDRSVTTDKMADNSVTYGKLAEEVITKIKSVTNVIPALTTITPELTPLINWEKMKLDNNNVDVRDTAVRNSGGTLRAYGGNSETLTDKYKSPSNGVILLKQSYKNFDAIAIYFTDDTGFPYSFEFLDVWYLDYMFNNLTDVCLFHRDWGWHLLPFKLPTGYSSGINPSTETLWQCWWQNSAIIEIYGIKYKRETLNDTSR